MHYDIFSLCDLNWLDAGLETFWHRLCRYNTAHIASPGLRGVWRWSPMNSENLWKLFTKIVSYIYIYIFILR